MPRAKLSVVETKDGRRRIEGTPRRADRLSDAERDLICRALTDNLLGCVLVDSDAANGHSEARKGA